MMRFFGLCIAVIAMLICAGPASAALLYDMNGPPPPSGFGPNGFPAPTITQDTIGATNGPNSMKYDIPIDGTFVGALTSVVPPPLNNPPGVKSILFDLTIEQGDEFTGAFADLGVTIFGFKGGSFGLQQQFTDLVGVGGFSAGTFTDVKIDLDASIQSGGKSFNEIIADGDFDGITGFQFFVSKSADAPLTLYIDNVRTMVPEPTSGILLCMAALAFGWFRTRR